MFILIKYLYLTFIRLKSIRLSFSAIYSLKKKTFLRIILAISTPFLLKKARKTLFRRKGYTPKRSFFLRINFKENFFINKKLYLEVKFFIRRFESVYRRIIL